MLYNYFYWEKDLSTSYKIAFLFKDRQRQVINSDIVIIWVNIITMCFNKLGFHSHSLSVPVYNRLSLP